ncbi:hypothetical protein MMC27_004129 [Xylographa pallens]|nr:hypothetical protein [Xylographa pallens]
MFQALNCLINEVSCPEPHSDALTAAMLLSSYEVVEASEASHRSHYQGALNLIRTRGISVTSTGLDRANFVVYVRHEITIALANESPLQLDLECWNMEEPEAGAAEDRMATYLIWLAAIAVNLVYDGEATIDRQELIDKVDSWYESTTQTFCGTEYGEINDEGLRKIFFAVPAAAGKHVDNITRKFRSWILLQDIELELGYRTSARVRSLKQMIGQK